MSCSRTHRSPRPAARARALAVAALVAAAGAAGCGGDGGAVAPGGEAPAFLDVSEIESVLEQGKLALVRSGGGEASDAGDVPARIIDAVRFATQSGRQFELFVFATPAAARDARGALLRAARGQHGADAAVLRAANAVAVFPAPPEHVDAFRAAADALSRLGAACILGDDAEESLRKLCFGGGGRPPPGGGVGRDTAQEEGDPIVVGGLAYYPLVARLMNRHLRPDGELLTRRPPRGRQWFGVFLRVCNDAARARRSAAQVVLVDAFGARARPVDDAVARPFGYGSQTIDADRCVPAPGSLAKQVGGGLLVVFAVSRDFLADRPVALEVSGRRAVLDV